MKREKSFTWKIIQNNLYAMKEAMSIARERVVCSIIKRLIEYLLWVFYSAFFVRFILDALEQEKPLKEILIAIVIIGGVSLILELFLYYCNNVLIPAWNVKIFHALYKRVYVKAKNVEIGCYENKEFYDKFSTAIDDMGNKLCQCVDNMSTVICGTIGGILACYTMVEIDPWTIVFLVAPLLGNFLFAPKMNKIFYDRYQDGVPYDRKLTYVNRIMYLPEYAKEFRLSNIFNVVERQYGEATEEKAGIWKKYFKRAFPIGMLQYFFSYMVIFEGILLYGAYQALMPAAPGITFSQMAVLTSVMVTASWVWVQVINAVNRGTENSLLVENLKNFLAYEEKIPENWEGELPEEEIRSIEFEHVSFAYTNGKQVLHDLSFKIESGKSLVLVGHNGAGKSTIIKLLLRFYDPTEGVIKVNGRDIREYQLAAYRKLFSCAFQDGTVLPGTVRYNVLMGSAGSDEKVENALKKAGVYEKISSLPLGIDTVLTKEFDEKGIILSGGEYQKILVARAFAKTSQIMIFDEPSSALDPIAEHELLSGILKETDGKTSILISHRLSCVKQAEHLIMLENGRIVEEGTHTELMDKGKKYAEFYRVQQQNYCATEEEEREVVLNEC
ncbi:MAG: ABC transporter ATP-binding protein [Lachnospiraceae bacterium]|nr:ABC transporter ATP-binding protein [Lachnospiraceae bacterium]